jgi:hypothetical protein
MINVVARFAFGESSPASCAEVQLLDAEKKSSEKSKRGEKE